MLWLVLIICPATVDFSSWPRHRCLMVLASGFYGQDQMQGCTRHLMSWPVGQSPWVEYIMGHNMKFNSIYIPDEALNCMYCIQIFISWVTLHKKVLPLYTRVWIVLCKKTQKSGYVTFSRAWLSVSCRVGIKSMYRSHQTSPINLTGLCPNMGSGLVQVYNLEPWCWSQLLKCWFSWTTWHSSRLEGVLLNLVTMKPMRHTSSYLLGYQ
jgi:hypothetical protein